MEYIVFGAGKDAIVVARNMVRRGCRIKYFVDNFNYNIDFKVDTKSYPVYYPIKLFDENPEEIHIIVASVESYESIAVQLVEMGFMEAKHFSGCLEWIQAQWGEVGELHPTYEFRVHQMAKYISPESGSVLDLGCGNMSLKKYLTKNVNYIPCDYIKHDETTVVCDFNKDAFPDVYADTIFMSGILEYIEHLEKFVENACAHANKEIICSFSVLEYDWNVLNRKRRSWVNHHTMMEIVELFLKNNMRMVQSVRTSTQMKQMIFVFEKM